MGAIPRALRAGLLYAARARNHSAQRGAVPVPGHGWARQALCVGMRPAICRLYAGLKTRKKWGSCAHLAISTVHMRVARVPIRGDTLTALSSRAAGSRHPSPVGGPVHSCMPSPSPALDYRECDTTQALAHERQHCRHQHDLPSPLGILRQAGASEQSRIRQPDPRPNVLQFPFDP